MLKNILANSKVVCLLTKFFQLVADYWSASVCCAFCCKAWQCICKWIKGSVVVRLICRALQILSAAWENSAVYRVLRHLVNLPMNLLRKLWTWKPAWLENSVMVRFALFLGKHAALLFGVLLVVFMITPYEIWNNGFLLICGVLIFLLVSVGGMKRANLQMNLPALGLSYVAFFAAVCLSWPLSMYPSESVRFLLYHAACALNVLVLVSVIDRPLTLERMAGFGCLGLLGASVGGLVQRMQGIEVDELLVDVSVNPDTPGRVFSFYDNPNAFAVVLVLLVPIAVALFLGAEELRWRILGLLSAAAGAVALIMTYSRGAWVGLMFAAFVFVLMWKPRLVPGLVVICLAAIPFLPSSILNRILSIFNSNDTSIASRVPLLEAGMRMIAARPLFGAGLGTDAVRHAIYKLDLYDGYSFYVHSHNTFVEIWLETGALGFFSFLATIVHTFFKGSKVLSNAESAPSLRLLIMGAMSGLCGSLVCGLVDYIWNYPRVMFLFWFVVGLLMAAAKKWDSADESVALA